MVKSIGIAATAAVVLCAATTAQATWSIVVADTRTGQVAIGSATCLTGFDLKLHLPVIIRNKGVGAAQSFVDFSGRNRLRIWEGLIGRLDPAEILILLEQGDTAHQTRQYGIVDTLGRAVTFSGTQNGAFANGLTGRVGDLVYAIQGNVLTGQPVIEAAEMAFVSTVGGLPEKLMAGMEAARAMGGDGRCSCTSGPPPSCGSPPPNFTKAAHIGFMVVSRRGDRRGVCNSTRGCGNGDYYMSFNVAFAQAPDPDPVFQLRDLFDAWRIEVIGLADAVTSRVESSASVLVNDGTSQAMVDIEVLDWQGNPAVGIINVAMDHNGGSAGSSAIGPVMDLGNGQYSVQLTAGTTAGLDVLRVTVEHANRSVILIPLLELRIAERGDMNADGSIDANDIEPFILALFDPDEYERRFPDIPRVAIGDMNLDGELNSADIEGFIEALFGP
ncbi:MAG: DUF1028 domain-containing protein [Planctomycetes bacterium]|nr:DUF1028 domain-containing protein [Planctomycetota bacterium]